MSDLHDAPSTEREPQIDTVGWLYSAVAVAIVVGAAVVAYKASDAIVHVPMSSQLVTR